MIYKGMKRHIKEENNVFKWEQTNTYRVNRKTVE